MREKPVVPIIVHLFELSNPEMLGAKIQTVAGQNGDCSQFLITIPERDPRPIVTGPQNLKEEI